MSLSSANKVKILQFPVHLRAYSNYSNTVIPLYLYIYKSIYLYVYISRTNVASVGSVFNNTRKVKVLSLPETIKGKIDVSSEGPSSGVRSADDFFLYRFR